MALPPSAHYVLLENRDTKHPANHYLTPSAAGRIARLAETYHKRFPADPVLRLNDASLERGGVFDFDFPGRTVFWRKPHKTHRFGKDIDIRANPKFNVDAIPEANFPGFQQLASQRVKCRAALHNLGTKSQHYHVTCP